MKKKIAVVIAVTLLAVLIAVSLDACKDSTATRSFTTLRVRHADNKVADTVKNGSCGAGQGRYN